MEETIILSLTIKAIFLVLVLSLPPIILAVLMGLMVSLLQALTQVQEQTLSFAVKLIVVVTSIVLIGAWIGEELLAFTIYIFERFPYLVT